MTSYAVASSGRVLVARMNPGEDVLPSLGRTLEAAGFHAAAIVSGVASLRTATLRNITSYPDSWPITALNRQVTRLAEPLEIVALQGNAARTGDGRLVIHCHACLSRGTKPGETVSGHLLEGTLVATTCEVVLLEFTGSAVLRVADPVTKVEELVFQPSKDA